MLQPSRWAGIPGQCSREGGPGPVPELKADLLLQQNPELEGLHKSSENWISHSFYFILLNMKNDAEILFYFLKYI